MRSKDHFRAAYQDGRVLETKVDVHARYSTIPIDLVEAISHRCTELPTLDVLDIGCGTGHFLTELANRGHHGQLAGVDLVAPSLPSDRWDFTEGDAESLPFPDDSFDVVVCLHTLSHIGDLAAAMREARRVLRPAGTYFATANSLTSYPHVDRYRRRVHDMLGWGQPRFTTSWVNAENLGHILADHWTTVSVEELDGELRIPTTGFVAYFAANIPTWERQPDDAETSRILECVAGWSDAEQEGGHLIEPKRVGLGSCSMR